MKASRDLIGTGNKLSKHSREQLARMIRRIVAASNVQNNPTAFGWDYLIECRPSDEDPYILHFNNELAMDVKHQVLAYSDPEGSYRMYKRMVVYGPLETYERGEG